LIHEHADAIGDLIERVDSQRQLHARLRAKLIDQQLRPRMTLQILKKQGVAAGRLWSAGARMSLPRLVALRNPIGDFGDLQNGIGFSVNSLELTGALKRRDPLTKVVEGQRFPLGCADSC
jgi:hypothetical protein